jgi:phosphoribosylformimino-5-aminoimidazole carboxamide ribotide isomerase
VRCIFVLDLFNGNVVHAVRGERSRYRLVEEFSRVVSTSDPWAVLDQIRPREVYVADLNRILRQGDNLEIIRSISCQASTMADIGARHKKDLDCLPKPTLPVLGTETAPFELIQEAALEREIVISLDMKSRAVLASDPDLAGASPEDILRRLNGVSARAIILLELDRVGTSIGLDREFLERAAGISDHALLLGGGVRGTEDLDALGEMGFEGALVATAVHSGRIPLERLR